MGAPRGHEMSMPWWNPRARRPNREVIGPRTGQRKVDEREPFRPEATAIVEERLIAFPFGGTVRPGDRGGTAHGCDVARGDGVGTATGATADRSVGPTGPRDVVNTNAVGESSAQSTQR